MRWRGSPRHGFWPYRPKESVRPAAERSLGGVGGQKYAHRAIKHLLIEELVTECHNMASSSWRVTEAHQHTTAIFTRACKCELAVLACVTVGLRF